MLGVDLSTRQLRRKTMKKYIIPQIKICKTTPFTLMDQTNADVHTDDPQPPGGAMGNYGSVWEDDGEEEGFNRNKKTIFDD